jgi:hypothetical protein
MNMRSEQVHPLRLIGLTCFISGSFIANISHVPWVWYATLLMVIGSGFILSRGYIVAKRLPALRDPLIWIAVCCALMGCVIFALQGIIPKVIAATVIFVAMYLWDKADKRSRAQ